jgi:hypothetical protein
MAVCPHGVAPDRLLPCRTCNPDAFAPPESRPPALDFEGRLRLLEEEFAYLKRPVHAAGFEIVVPQATGEGEERWGTISLPYNPFELEWFHGLSLVPDESVWVAGLMVGRSNFFDRRQHTSQDLRRIGVMRHRMPPMDTIDSEGGPWTPCTLFPNVGIVLTLHNSAPLPKKIRGAFLVEFRPLPALVASARLGFA